MPTPDPTPAHVQAELAPESLRLPSFPPAWPGDAPRRDKVMCHVGLEINEEGVPTSVTRRDCPVPFFAVGEEAAMQWRWYPMRPDPCPVRFDINFVLRMVDER
ncbi:MAG: hypothetical protein FJ090_16585 [Deltaproteobacteria bacterium]|nr:hypothetical protein [Deltaproteobacteria bacterium]